MSAQEIARELIAREFDQLEPPSGHRWRNSETDIGMVGAAYLRAVVAALETPCVLMAQPLTEPQRLGPEGEEGGGFCARCYGEGGNANTGSICPECNGSGKRLTTPAQAEPVAWIVTDGGGSRFRTWADGMPCWTFDREQAIRYARRDDAEMAHAEDDDAWSIIPYAKPL